MDRILDRYHAISFRGRLLLLLVVVSLIQASVAAYTFFELQSRPAEQRVHAQLNAAMRGIAPVIDAELQRSAGHLRSLHQDPTLQTAIENQDIATIESIIGSDASSEADLLDSSTGLEDSVATGADLDTSSTGRDAVLEADLLDASLPMIDSIVAMS